MMKIGDLRHRITLQKSTTITDNYGEPLNTWEDIKTVWSSINAIVGKEYFAAETVQSEISHKIRIRYIPEILPSMRINFKGRIFSIISVINYQERNVELQLMCKELI